MERDAADAMPYLEAAIPVGLAGAIAVAAFVFCLDWAMGRPLATPNALGATIFRGEAFDLDAPIRTVHVFSYTLLHSSLFVIAATAAITAQFTWIRQGLSKTRQFAIGTPLLVVALQSSFMVMMGLLEVAPATEFGALRLLAVNTVAAVAMSAVLFVRPAIDADGRPYEGRA
jgi:hypothetical protein